MSGIHIPSQREISELGMTGATIAADRLSATLANGTVDDSPWVAGVPAHIRRRGTLAGDWEARSSAGTAAPDLVGDKALILPGSGEWDAVNRFDQSLLTLPSAQGWTVGAFTPTQDAEGFVNIENPGGDGGGSGYGRWIYRYGLGLLDTDECNVLQWSWRVNRWTNGQQNLRCGFANYLDHGVLVLGRQGTSTNSYINVYPGWTAQLIGAAWGLVEDWVMIARDYVPSTSPGTMMDLYYRIGGTTRALSQSIEDPSGYTYLGGFLSVQCGDYEKLAFGFETFDGSANIDWGTIRYAHTKEWRPLASNPASTAGATMPTHLGRGYVSLRNATPASGTITGIEISTTETQPAAVGTITGTAVGDDAALFTWDAVAAVNRYRVTGPDGTDTYVIAPTASFAGLAAGSWSITVTPIGTNGIERTTGTDSGDVILPVPAAPTPPGIPLNPTPLMPPGRPLGPEWSEDDMNVLARKLPALSLGDLPILWFWLGTVTADGAAPVKLDGVTGIAADYSSSQAAYPTVWTLSDLISSYTIITAWAAIIAAVRVDFPAARFKVGYWDGQTEVSWSGAIDPDPRSAHEITISGEVDPDYAGKGVSASLAAPIMLGGRVYLKKGPYEAVIDADGRWSIYRLPRGGRATFTLPTGGSPFTYTLPDDGARDITELT